VKLYLYSTYIPSCYGQGLVLQKLKLLSIDDLDNVNYIHYQINKIQLKIIISYSFTYCETI